MSSNIVQPFQQTSGGESEKQSKAYWDDITMDAFIKVCVTETLAGNRPNSDFNKLGWKNVIKAFNNLTGRNYQYRQLKNKWSSLKKDWQLWNTLIGKETGLGWDPMRQTINASNEWWDKKLKENPEAIKFKTKGLKNVEQLDILFKDIIATGEGAWAPSQGFVGQEVDDSSKVGEHEDNIIEDQDDSSCNPPLDTIFNGFEATTQPSMAKKNEGRRKRKRNETKSELVAIQLERICSAVENRSSISSKGDKSGCSIAEVMKIIRGMPEVKNDFELYMKAIDIMVVKENRDMFVALEDPIDQIAWLKHKHMPSNNNDQNFDDESDDEHGFYQLVLAGCAAAATFTSHGLSNRMIQERFQHSGESVSRWFEIVLDVVCLMAIDIIKPSDPQFKEVPDKIRNDDRYWPYFKNCIGVINGTHIPVVVPRDRKIPYIGRKGVTTQNVMAVCDFNMCFTFAWAGWEGAAHDARVFLEALRRPELGFPHPPRGKYYLVDAGYPQMSGYLGTYKGERYHLPDFRRGSSPKGKKEIFNHRHSSLRCTIERTFAVLKNRWRMLREMHSFPLEKQVKIVIASMALHNFIRINARMDMEFKPYDDDQGLLPLNEEESRVDSLVEEDGSHHTREMEEQRDRIANLLISH
ncbi:L10-interacting MYB domain-containing protein [Vitis vinifera]|uniref:L10-interacting MYB domain-containing protein n=1 Tax=Vitis vinifera TaxID=29760 RepID=A0A438JR82_VITVI|nr:L10-interacting MYB domain-containing protein [Vitis vinifera]